LRFETIAAHAAGVAPALRGWKLSSRLPWAAMVASVLSASACSMSARPAEDVAAVLSEAELQLVAQSIDEKVVQDDLVLADSRLDAYLQRVVARLLAASGERVDRVRVRVIRNPVLGASALANGVLHVHTGILARLGNEAQLATLLGHELEHFLGRHAVREMHLRSNPTMAASAVAGDEGSERRDVDAAIRRFERQLEREADEAGLRRMAAAGYEPSEAPRFFEMLLADEIEAGITRDHQRGNHPAAHERLTRCQLQAAELCSANAQRRTIVGQEEYEQAIADMLLENARMDLDLGRIDLAQAAIERHLRTRPQSRRGHQMAEILAEARAAKAAAKLRAGLGG